MRRLVERLVSAGGDIGYLPEFDELLDEVGTTWPYVLRLRYANDGGLDPARLDEYVALVMGEVKWSEVHDRLGRDDGPTA